MSTTLSKKTMVPWWAAFGAPLLGIPVLVAVLALGTAHSRDAGADAVAQPDYVAEHVESLQASLDRTAAKLDLQADARG